MINPFRHDYFLGYINQVFPQFVKIHFPSSVLLNGFTHYGQEFNGGLVGNFVIIEGDKYGFLGRITELVLPESERLSLNEKAFQTSDFHPVGKIEILISFDHYNPFEIKRGLTAYPNIGAKVFVCSSELLQEYMSRFGSKGDNEAEPIRLGHLVSNPATEVKVNLQSIFGRHCAIVGTTGGGKSYTVSRLLESISQTENKGILIDATGEYSTLDHLESIKTLTVGIDCFFHYSNLSVIDIFLLFRPSGQVQQPLLLEAIKSLKLVSILESEKSNSTYTVTIAGTVTTYTFKGKNNVTLSIDIDNGCLLKQGRKTAAFNRLCAKYSERINNFNKADFDITKLSEQINNECFQIFGDEWSRTLDQRNQGNASSLILRIHQTLSDQLFKQIFGFDNAKKVDIVAEIEEFIKPESKHSIFRISFEHVPFNYHIREIVANSLGLYLLYSARMKRFDSKSDKLNKPLILIVDEAHQFLNKSISDEFFESKPLDAFNSIAKECRKHGLFLCIATQMPRDIPQGTLSQMGTFIVHRLINHNDKEAINSACSSANRNTLEFLPVLGEGEAILTGVDFPMPIIMKFDKPSNEPNSKTPLLK